VDTASSPTDIVTPNEQSPPPTETTLPGFDFSLLGVLFVFAILIARIRL